jgi:hypothetical protein
MVNCERRSEEDIECGRREPANWVELRDDAGKLQGKWDPVARMLEIQRRGVKTRYPLGAVGERHD